VTYQRVMDILERNKGIGTAVKIQMDGKVFATDFTVSGIDMLKSQLALIIGYGNVKILGE